MATYKEVLQKALDRLDTVLTPEPVRETRGTVTPTPVAEVSQYQYDLNRIATDLISDAVHKDHPFA